MKISGIIWDDIANGEGIRETIFFSGCKHECKGCQNPETWDFDRGIEFDRDIIGKIFIEIDKNPMITGITLTGGDPMYFAKELVPFLKLFKEKYPDKDVWLYTGFTWGEIIHHQDMKKLAELCDVIIDGPFKIEERDITLPFRGSKNQRIIDCKKSFMMDRVVEKVVD